MITLALIVVAVFASYPSQGMTQGILSDSQRAQLDTVANLCEITLLRRTNWRQLAAGAQVVKKTHQIKQRAETINGT